MVNTTCRVDKTLINRDATRICITRRTGCDFQTSKKNWPSYGQFRVRWNETHTYSSVYRRMPRLILTRAKHLNKLMLISDKTQHNVSTDKCCVYCMYVVPLDIKGRICHFAFFCVYFFILCRFLFVVQVPHGLTVILVLH